MAMTMKHPGRMHMGSDKLIFGAALASIALSLLMVRKNPLMATFTGLWAPTILGMGIMRNEKKLLKGQEHTALTV